MGHWTSSHGQILRGNGTAEILADFAAAGAGNLALRGSRTRRIHLDPSARKTFLKWSSLVAQIQAGPVAQASACVV
jgi:hypothetical protein